MFIIFVFGLYIAIISSVIQSECNPSMAFLCGLHSANSFLHPNPFVQNKQINSALSSNVPGLVFFSLSIDFDDP